MASSLAMSEFPMSEEHEHSPTETTRVFTDILDMARTLCANTRLPNGKRLKLTDYLDSILRERVSRDYDEMLKRMNQQRRKS